MTTKIIDRSQRDKMVLVRLKPEMTREQMKQNLIDALEKNGIKVRPAPQQTDDGGTA